MFLIPTKGIIRDPGWASGLLRMAGNLRLKGGTLDASYPPVAGSPICEGNTVLVRMHPDPLPGLVLSVTAAPAPQESGLSVWIGGQLHPLENVPPVLAVMLITIVIAFFTEFASNTATIIIFLPVLAELVRVLLGGEGGPDSGASSGAVLAIPVFPNAWKCQSLSAIS